MKGRAAGTGRCDRVVRRWPPLVAAFLAATLSGCGTTLIGALGALGASGSGGGGGGSAPPPANQPPVAVIATAPEGVVNDRVTVTYRLIDPEGDPADVSVEVSLDGAPFVQAVEAQQAGSSGTTGLATSSTGELHTFVWNSFVQTGVENHEVVLRITPRDSAVSDRVGEAVETEPFSLRNAYIASVVSGVDAVASEDLGVPDTVLVLTDASGAATGFLVSDLFGNRVLHVDAATGERTTFAGTGDPGYNGDNIPANEAQLSTPMGLAMGPDGAVYIADAGNRRIRRVDPDTGFITTVAGGGSGGGRSNGDGGLATEARLPQPVDVAVDEAGNLYIADGELQTVRVVNRSAQVIELGTDRNRRFVCVQPATIETLLDVATERRRLGVSGPLVGGQVVAAGDSVLSDVWVDGKPGLVPDGDCNALRSSTSTLRVLVADAGAGTVYERASDGTFSAVAGIEAGDAFVAAPDGLELSPPDLLMFADRKANVVWTKTLGTTDPASAIIGTPPPVNGQLPPPSSSPFTDVRLQAPRCARFWVPSGGSRGVVVLVADAFARRVLGANFGVGSVVVGGVQIPPSETREVLVGGQADDALQVPASCAIAPDGSLYYADVQGRRVLRLDLASTAVAEVVTMTGLPVGMAISPDGTTLAVADAEAHRVYGIDLAQPSLAVIAGTGTPTDKASDLGDGGPATQATLRSPTDVAYEGQHLYIADAGNGRIRRVDLVSGLIETFVNARVAGDGKPEQGFDANDRTLLDGPLGIGVDAAAGRLLVCDSGNERVLAVDLAAAAPVQSTDVVIIAGSAADPVTGYNGDHRPAVGAWLDTPLDVTATASGTIVFTDRDNHRLRSITGDIYRGAGVIESVAGIGIATYNGDAIPAVNAALNEPSGLAFDAATGAIYVADLANLRVRRLAGP
ncbi:MAG: hypothetical protein D6776_11790 [Planctomycetota bacterium]|nr:MAG: hypothetical protein D6776_11790 [Planctomycetota bacterium]